MEVVQGMVTARPKRGHLAASPGFAACSWVHTVLWKVGGDKWTKIIVTKCKLTAVAPAK